MFRAELLINETPFPLVYQHIQLKSLAHIRSILFLEPAGEPLPEHIYLCTLDSFPESFVRAADCTYLLCTDPDGEVDPQALLTRFGDSPSNILVYRAGIFQLYNHVSTIFMSYHQWQFDLRSTDDVQILAEYFFIRTRIPIAVLGSFFQQIAFCSNRQDTDPLFPILGTGDPLPHSLVKELLVTERKQRPHMTITFRMDGHTYLAHHIRKNDKTVARILFSLPGEELTDRSEHYIDDFIHVVTPIILTNDAMAQLSKDAFGSLIADLVDLRIKDTEELQRRLELEPGILKGKFFHVIVIRFSRTDRAIPYHYISGQLEQIFPNSSATSYEDTLVVIASKGTYDEEVCYDEGLLTDLLVSFDAYAGIGNCTRFLINMRSLYLQALATARLGRIYCKEKKQRIFRYNDYMVYFITDLCFEAAVKLHQFTYPAHLCHPGVIAILQYDKSNGTSLEKTLRAYLHCNCNATLCAKELFVHRNTINYRIGVIEDLLKGSLSDPMLRTEILLSLRILEHEKQYHGIDELARIEKTAMHSDIRIKK